MKQPIKPKIPKPIFKKPDPFIPKVEYIPGDKKKPKVISDFQMFLIELKRWVEKMTERGVRIGFDALFDRFSVLIWVIVLMFIGLIIFRIFK